jgi:hypothetical protein
MSMPAAVRIVLALVCTVAVSACGDRASAGPGGGWTATTDTIGDTVVVRTGAGSLRGSAVLVPEVRIGALDGADHEMFGNVSGFAAAPDGSVVAYDGQVPALRRYAADGSYLGSIGRKGGGPGEYENSDGGIVVLPDGRVVLRDPGNARFGVWDAEGRPLETWPARGGTMTSTPIFPASDGGFFNPIFEFGPDGVKYRVTRHSSDGTAFDTLDVPGRSFEAATLEAAREGARSMRNVPFSPSVQWTLHPDGYFVFGISDRYAVDLLRPDAPVLRLARDIDPVPVSADERRAQEEFATRAMRQTDPSWRWNGPPIPQVKPYFGQIHTGSDGRIWIQRSTPGERIPDDELEPTADGTPPPARFRSPIAFDVFEPDGHYLRPLFGPDAVWAIERDELDVQYLVRFRIEWDDGGPD